MTLDKKPKSFTIPGEIYTTIGLNKSCSLCTGFSTGFSAPDEPAEYTCYYHLIKEAERLKAENERLKGTKMKYSTAYVLAMSCNVRGVYQPKGEIIVEDFRTDTVAQAITMHDQCHGAESYFDNSLGKCSCFIVSIEE